MLNLFGLLSFLSFLSFLFALPPVLHKQKNVIPQCRLLSHNIDPFIFGTYSLRTTTNNDITSNYTFLIIKDATNIKIKTIQERGFLATKVSKTGTIEYKPTFKNVYNILCRKPMYDVTIKINNVNKYSYSLFGIEFPEFRYKQISNYNICYDMQAKYMNKMLYILDSKTKEYYIFDLYYNNNKSNKLPYIDVSFNTFVITQLLSFVINILLVNYIHAIIPKDAIIIP